MPAKSKVQSISSKKTVRPKADRRDSKSSADRGASMREEVTAYRKDLILRAATDAFFEYGYHDCTVDLIAEKLSGTKAIVYYYFPDKHSILREIYRRALEAVQQLMAQAISDNTDPGAKIAAVARGYAKWVIDNQRLVGIFWREERSLSPAARAEVAIEQKKIDDLLAAVIRDGVAKGLFEVQDTQTTARAIAGMISFTYTWWRSDRRLSREDTAEYYARTAQRLVGIHSH